MKEMESVYLKKTGVLVTREATVVDFETPQIDAERARVVLEQFALEYDSSSVIVISAIKTRIVEGLPRSSSNIMLWRATWLHESEKPPYDFAICPYSRN